MRLSEWLTLVLPIVLVILALPISAVWSLVLDDRRESHEVWKALFAKRLN